MTDQAPGTARPALEGYNFAYLDEQTKRMVRRAILKALAVPGYQVPFASREMPLPYGWGTGGIQVTAYEWSGRRQQVEIAPWTFLAGDASVLALADRLQAHPRGHTAFPTALGYALGHAASLFRSAPLDCTRKVIDVSGDGVNNEGFSPELAYANFPFEGVQVNGLVIAGARPDPVAFYQEHVLYGPGAFLEIADGFADFEAAMKRKLLREIIGGALSSVPDRRRAALVRQAGPSSRWIAGAVQPAEASMRAMSSSDRPQFVDEHVGDDVAERLVVLGPVVEDRPPVERDAIDLIAGRRVPQLGDAAPFEEPEQIERRLEPQIVGDVLGREFGDADLDVAGQLAELARQVRIGFPRDLFDLGEAGRKPVLPVTLMVENGHGRAGYTQLASVAKAFIYGAGSGLERRRPRGARKMRKAVAVATAPLHCLDTPRSSSPLHLTVPRRTRRALPAEPDRASCGQSRSITLSGPCRPSLGLACRILFAPMAGARLHCLKTVLSFDIKDELLHLRSLSLRPFSRNGNLFRVAAIVLRFR